MNKIISIMDKEFQDVSVQIEGVSIAYNNLERLDKCVFYFAKNMNGPLLTMLAGLITSLSVNLLTNFLDIDIGLGFIPTIFSVTKLLSCLIFNVAFVCFTIISMNMNNSIDIPRDLIPRDIKQREASQYLQQYWINKKSLKCCFVLSLIFGILTVAMIIATPFVNYWLQGSRGCQTVRPAKGGK